MRTDRPLVSSQYIVSLPQLAEQDLLFTEFSGIKERCEPRQHRDPFLLRAYTTPGIFRSLDPIELSGPMLEEMYSTIDGLWRVYDNRPLLINIQPTWCNPQGGRTFLPYRYQLEGCTWLALEHTATSRQSEQPNMIRCRFSVVSYSRIPNG